MMVNDCAHRIENLSYLSTEKNNDLTKNLSSIMHKNCVEGLKLLHAADQKVLDGFQEFIQKYITQLKSCLQKAFTRGGRCFLIGSGSSGRIAIDVAAKASQKNIIGLIAGGDVSFIRAQEGFEDSQAHGAHLIEDYEITSKDLVILISASASAAFNVGCAKAAQAVGATIYYFYNSAQIPHRTQELFDRYGVQPVLIDIGPQAIAGSTRLQAATLAELCLGSLFSPDSPEKILKELVHANTIIAQHFETIAQIILLEYEVFSSPDANFRKQFDETNQGYVTFFASKDAFREIMIDTAETAPTFSTNPPRSIHEKGKKKAEFQAFMIGNYTNEQAWHNLLARDMRSPDYQNAAQFIITTQGANERPLGKGNLIIGVAKNTLSQSLFNELSTAHNAGAKTAVIFIHDQAQHIVQETTDCVLSLNTIYDDSLGLIQSITLKQVLNMISNGSMILMNKVDGNQMIDVNASNKKLIDRTIRLIHDIFLKYRTIQPFEYAFLKDLVESICVHKKEYDKKNIYTPAPVKIGVTMLQRKLNFDQAIAFLTANQENIEKVFS